MTVIATEHLLVVDDDPQLRELLTRYPGEQGFRVSAVADGAAMDALLAREQSDLVILDLMLPGEDVDRIVGLEVGADDYLPKPFNPRELLARIRAVLRRPTEQTAAAPTIKSVYQDKMEDEYAEGRETPEPVKRGIARARIGRTVYKAKLGQRRDSHNDCYENEVCPCGVEVHVSPGVARQ